MTAAEPARCFVDTNVLCLSDPETAQHAGATRAPIEGYRPCPKQS